MAFFPAVILRDILIFSGAEFHDLAPFLEKLSLAAEVLASSFHSLLVVALNLLSEWLKIKIIKHKNNNNN